MKCILPKGLIKLDEYDKCLSRGQTTCERKRKQAKDELSSRFNLIGEGSARVAFDLGDDCVLKFGGLQSSLMEADVWNHVKDTSMWEWFVPVDDYSKTGSWLLMPKVIKNVNNDEFHSFVDNMYIIVNGHKKWVDCWDLTIGNVGRHNGKVKAFDYESCYEWFTLRASGAPYPSYQRPPYYDRCL